MNNLDLSFIITGVLAAFLLLALHQHTKAMVHETMVKQITTIQETYNEHAI